MRSARSAWPAPPRRAGSPPASCTPAQPGPRGRPPAPAQVRGEWGVGGWGWGWWGGARDASWPPMCALRSCEVRPRLLSVPEEDRCTSPTPFSAEQPVGKCTPHLHGGQQGVCVRHAKANLRQAGSAAIWRRCNAWARGDCRAEGCRAGGVRRRRRGRLQIRHAGAAAEAGGAAALASGQPGKAGQSSKGAATGGAAACALECGLRHAVEGGRRGGLQCRNRCCGCFDAAKVGCTSVARGAACLGAHHLHKPSSSIADLPRRECCPAPSMLTLGTVLASLLHLRMQVSTAYALHD